MSPRRRQRGAASLVMGLLILLALSVVTLLGAHVVLTEHRMVRNDAAADTAFAVAEAGLQAGQAYLLANRTEILDATWHDCSTSDTAPPCGDGNDNQRGAGWQYLGPVQHLPPLGGNVPYTVWYLSNTLGSTPQTTPWIGCQQLSLLSGGPTSTMLLSPIFEIGGTLATTLIDQVNGLVGQATSILNGVLNTLIGTSPILPGSLGIPNKLCLPINFTQMSRVPRPSRINPTLYILAQAETATGGAGAVAQLQQGVQATSIYARSPLAAIMAGGDANLVGDVRVWGNPRPPTTPPYDFSTLNLNNLNPLGLPVSDLVDSTLAPLTTSLAPLVAPLLDPALGDQLDTDSTTLLSLQANVTFPLSIWAGGTVYLLPEPGQPAQVKTSHIGGVIGGLLDTLGLGGLVNGLLDGINNMLNGLLCVLGLCSNPDPMVPNPAALLNSARTCLPQWPGNQVPAVTGAPRDACLPLSQTITVLQGMIDPGAAAQPAHCEKWLLLICVKWSPATPGTNPDPPNDLSIPLKLPDVQDKSLTLQTIKNVLLQPDNRPDFPPDLFDYIFGTPEAQAADKIKPEATVADNCAGLDANSHGLYWVTGDCAPSGDVGSDGKPVILIIQGGTLTLPAGSTLNGIVYMMGTSQKTITSAVGGDRATLRGGLLVDGKLYMQGPINVVYDQRNIRAAGFAAGSFAPLPGSWNDTWSVQ